MKKVSFRTLLHLAMLTLVIFTLTGCTSRLDGKYETANSMMTVEFKGDKAYVGALVGQVETTYEIKDDKVTLKYNGENLVLTRNSDGSLDGPMGKMIKK
ncbi:MAG TPA: hypothetical protein VKU00_02580 [Chthonomonadaceae bacterium]|nr:hypothetical protein [Chthonomonadaceae bacterium]